MTTGCIDDRSVRHAHDVRRGKQGILRMAHVTSDRQAIYPHLARNNHPIASLPFGVIERGIGARDQTSHIVILMHMGQA